MIRINLLLVREARHKETARQQVILFLLFLAVTVVVMAGIQWYLISRIHVARHEITLSEDEINQLKTKIGQIENIKKLQEDVQKKLAVLKQLRAGRDGPVKRLAALSDSTPDKVWLTKYTDFMRNLENSGQFNQVELLLSEQLDISGVKAKRFDLTCKLGAPHKETPKPPQPSP
jgi:type IV pilus assembly protein PilN